MARPLLDDALWAAIQPLLPAPPPRRRRYPGRKRVEARRCLTGVLFVLKTGIPWEALPQELGGGSGMTCRRRLRDWQAAGVWAQLQAVLLARPREADQLDWSRAVIDAAAVRAVGGGGKNRPQSGRSAQAWLRASRRDRRGRRSLGRPAHRGQSA